MVVEHFRPSGSKTWKPQQETREFLGYLAGFPGDTWQERWEASDHDTGRPVGQAAGDNIALRRRLSAAAGRAFAMRLIHPTLLGPRSNTFTRYAPWFRSVADDPWLEEFCERVDRLPVGAARRGRAKSDLCYTLTVFGIDLDGLTPEALLHYAVECRAHALAGENAESGTYSGTPAWPVLHEMRQFPASAPKTLRAAVTRGRLSVEKAVDRHRITNREMRDLLVEYISRRAAELDYSTLRHLINRLVKTFWKVIEEINPDQADCGCRRRPSHGGRKSCSSCRAASRAWTWTAHCSPSAPSISTRIPGPSPNPSGGRSGSRPARSATPTCATSSCAGAVSRNGWPTAPGSVSHSCQSCPSTSTTPGTGSRPCWRPPGQ
ncbi:hypothetical protein ACFXKF_27090 [Streptomyces scopuliridis]|uniref:hypothetical protein n=1 Tax=Streptomyces scopuliridis TaxID=452529 RepID=UPI00369E807A